MLKIYGSMLCPDCVKCREDLDNKSIPYTFLDFSEKLSYLKEFLEIREREEVFDQIKKEGKIGIPCIVKQDGSVTLQWDM